MLVRVIQLMNNYYRDNVSEKKEPLGEYCVLGCYDAMSILDAEETENFSETGIVRGISQLAFEKYDGTCNRQNIICVTEEKEKDEKFWENAKNAPYLFVTMGRILFNGEQDTKTLKEQVKDINKAPDVMAYYTYSHSELIILRCGTSYEKCMKNIFSTNEKLKIFKSFSIFGVREEVLEKLDNIEHEIVSVRLNGIVHDRIAAQNFINKLETIFADESSESHTKVTAYDTLGARDLIIEISQVDMHQLLTWYRMGEMLTHAADTYCRSFFNIETEILVLHTQA